jgi:hypothetical protein
VKILYLIINLNSLVEVEKLRMPVFIDPIFKNIEKRIP